MKTGDRILVCDSAGTDYNCTITEIHKDSVIAVIDTRTQSNTEPPYRVHLFQALPKSDKMDSIIQKAVECGVYSLTPMLTERCISRPDGASGARKSERWQKIAESAAKQCGRGIVPKINIPVSFSDALKEGGSADLAVVCYEGDGTLPLPKLFSEYLAKAGSAPSDIAVMIGPEGGFGLSEVESAKASGFFLAGLGRRILRTETASGFFLACAAYAFEL